MSHASPPGKNLQIERAPQFPPAGSLECDPEKKRQIALQPHLIKG